MTKPVAVIIPALNAARTIAQLVRECIGLAGSVVVVDDGSTDQTSTEALSAGAIVLRHEKNRGKGGALKTGFAWALENDVDGVVTLDADGQHLPAEIPRFLAARIETGADLIIGSRAHLFHGMLPRRRLANRFSAATITNASGVRLSDSQSGFRFYSSNLLRRIQLRTDGFDMESEVIVRAGRGGFRVVTIPIDLGFVDGLSTSHYKPLADTLRIAWTVVRTRYWR